MFAAVHLPRFALQAVLRTQPQEGLVPMAILDVTEDGPSERAKIEQQRLLHVNAGAERCGVHAGMAAGMAMARCGRLVLLHRNAAAEQETQRLLLECASQWTPYYETSAPGLCVMDVSRIRGMTRRLEKCGRSLHAHLAASRIEARVGFAPGVDLAVLAAHAAQPVLVWRDGGSDAATYLRELPLSALGPEPDTAELLRLWGVRTLGELLRLSRQEVVLRLGPEGMRLWDMAAGGKLRLLRLFRPAMPYRDEMELEHPVEALEPLLFLLRRMLDTLCRRLAENWLVAKAMQLQLGFEDKQTRESVLRIAEPTRNMDLLLRLLQTHMDGVSAPAPIIRVALELMPVRSAGSQMNIFERGMRDPNRFAETLAQIEAIVGSRNAGRVRLLPSRALDAFEITPFLDESGMKGSALFFDADASGLHSHGLPLRRVRPPRPIEVTLLCGHPSVMHVGGESHSIVRCSGPWLVSGDWWDDARWQREVWEVETSEGSLNQIARHNGEWQMEGVFG
jgi:protein ImuB